MPRWIWSISECEPSVLDAQYILKTQFYSWWIYMQFPQIYCLSTISRGILRIQHTLDFSQFLAEIWAQLHYIALKPLIYSLIGFSVLKAKLMSLGSRNLVKGCMHLCHWFAVLQRSMTKVHRIFSIWIILHSSPKEGHINFIQFSW